MPRFSAASIFQHYVNAAYDLEWVVRYNYPGQAVVNEVEQKQ